MNFNNLKPFINFNDLKLITNFNEKFMGSKNMINEKYSHYKKNNFMLSLYKVINVYDVNCDVHDVTHLIG